MKQTKKLVIVNNEKIFNNKDNYYCENIDVKSTAEGLGENFNVSMIVRGSKKKKVRNSRKLY